MAEVYYCNGVMTPMETKYCGKEASAVARARAAQFPSLCTRGARARTRDGVYACK